MTTTIYEPRCSAQLIVAEMGLPPDRAAQALTEDTFILDVRPLKVRLECNSYREADSCDITCSFDEAGIDPRALRSATVSVWLGDGGDAFERSDANLRFVGIVRDVERDFNENSKLVNIRCVDFTSLFIENKPFPASRFPACTDTLRSAWKTICRYTGHLSAGADVNNPSAADIISSVSDDDGTPRIDIMALGDVSLDVPILKVDPRLASAPLFRESGEDSWAVWIHVVEAMGLISFIRGRQCFVTQATSFYTQDDPPALIYGQNVLTLTEKRDLGSITGKNVCVRSYDGMAGTMLESFYPPTSSPLAAKSGLKKIVLPNAGHASKTGAPNAKTINESFELIDLQIAVTDQATLDLIAENIWHERVRAELSGTLTTREMYADTTLTAQASPGSHAFDLLGLQAGDNITVQIEQDSLDTIQSLPEGARLAALLARGYSDQMSQYIVANLSSLTTQPAQFLVHSVDTEFDSTGDSFNMTIGFLNTIAASGDVDLQVLDAPPLTGSAITDAGEIDVTDAGELDVTDAGEV